MSQQEFMPQSQDKSAQYQDHDTSSTQSHSRSTKSRARAMPKSEHPSAYSEPEPPYSYHAQDNVTPANKTTGSQSRRKLPGRHFSPDGDAFETHYRPYTQYRTQPQTSRRAGPRRYMRSIIKVILVLAIIAFLLQVAIFLVSIVAIIILLPLLIVLALVVTYIVLRVLIFLGVGRRRQRGAGNVSWWR